MSTITKSSNAAESAIGKEKLLQMYRRMTMIRVFEEQVNELYTRALMPGLAHLYIGEEAVAVGICEALNIDDYVTSTHRGSGVSTIAAGLSGLQVLMSNGQLWHVVGNTAEPRGVVLTHGNFLANLEPLERGIDPYRKYERWFHPLRFVTLVPPSTAPVTARCWNRKIPRNRKAVWRTWGS